MVPGPCQGRPCGIPVGASGMYIGLPGSSAMLWAPATGCHCPASVAMDNEARAEELELSRVIPIPSSWRTWPRSTVKVSGHELVHQDVAASPSIAFEGGLADWDAVAVAWPESAQSMVGASAPSCGAPR